MATIVDDMNGYFGWFGDSWSTDHTADSQTPKYFNSTFHGSITNGDYCVVKWTGTDIAVYGARRDNHGIYGVALDSGDVQYYSGYSQDSTFQQVLYASSGLAQGDHTIKISNENARDTGEYPTYIWLDIDYVAFTGTMINAGATNAAPPVVAPTSAVAETTADNPPTTNTPASSIAPPPVSSPPPTPSPTTAASSSNPSPPLSSVEAGPLPSSITSSSFTISSTTSSGTDPSSIGQYINSDSQSTPQPATTLNANTFSSSKPDLGTKTTGTPDLPSTVSTSVDSGATATSANEGSGSTESHKTTVVAVSVTVIVIAAVVIATIGGLWYWRRRKRLQEDEKEDADYLAAPRLESSWR